MDNIQLSKPLLSEVKSLEKAALLSMIVDKEFKPNQKATTVYVGDKKAKLTPMEESITNVSMVFNRHLPSEIRMPYHINSMVQLSDETHLLACTYEGLALYIDTKTKKFDEKKICDSNDNCESLDYVVVPKGEQKAIFAGGSTLFEVKLPSLIKSKEKTFDLDGEIGNMVLSSDQNSLYVLLKDEKVIKVNPENFKESEDVLEGAFVAMALSRNGELATFSNERKLTLTNLQTSSKQEVKIELEGDIQWMEFSSSQSKILVASSKAAVLVNVNPLEVTKTLSMKGEISYAAIANDDNTLLVGDDSGKLAFWDFKNQEQRSEIQVHSKSLNYIKLSAEGKLIYSCGDDKKFCTVNFPEFSKDLYAKVDDFSPSSLGAGLIISPKIGAFKKWDLATNKTEDLGVIEEFEVEDVDDIAVIDDNTIIVIKYYDIMKYNFRNKEHQAIPLTDDNEDTIYAHALSPDKAFLATGGSSQKVFLWDLRTMKKVAEFKGSDDYIAQIIFLPNLNYIVAGNDSGNVYFWDITTKECKEVLKGEKDQPVKSLCAFDNEQNVAIGYENGSILVFNWKSKTQLAALKAGGEILKVHIVKDGKSMIVATSEGKIFFWNLLTLTQLFHYDIKQEILSFGLTADEKYFVYQISTKVETIKKQKTVDPKEENKENEEKEEKEEKEEEESGEESGEEKVGKEKGEEEESGEEKGEDESEREEKERKRKDSEESEEEEQVESDAANLFIKKNPLVTDVLVAAGPGSESSYMKYVMDLINSKGKQHKPEFDKWVIMPYRINTLHLYAYYNHPNMLKAALDAGGSLFDTNFDENALSFAIHKEFSGCVSAIVSSFGKLLKGNPNALNFVSQDCILGLNRLGYPSLTKFYKLIYTPYAGKFTKFVDETTPTPIYCHSKTIYPLEANFVQQEANKKEGKPVKCMVTSLPLPLTNGTKESTDFLDSLEECPNSAIFTSKLIQDILDHKWDELKWAMYAQAIIYTIYMILLSVYILYFIGQSLPLLIIFLFSLLLTSYEVFQFVTSPSEYIEDVWNYIDGIRTILTVVYAAIIWMEGKNTDLSYDILVALVIVSWMRGITYFRIFQKTRYMVNLITQVIIDITSFLILLFYSTLAFAFIFLVMDKDDPKLIDYIKMSYRLDLGDFDASSLTSTQWVCLFLATMINMIIMLNLLISIMGDTFGKVQENAEVADRKELLGMITEIETLMFWKKNITERSYFQVLVGEESEEAEQNVNTRLSLIKKNIKANHLQNQKRFDSLEEMVKKIWTKLEGEKKEENEDSYDSDSDESGEESGEEDY